MHQLKKKLIELDKDTLARIAAVTILQMLVQSHADKNKVDEIYDTYGIDKEVLEKTRQEILEIENKEYDSPFEALKAHTKYFESVLITEPEEGEKDERSSD
jgi:hypothetical protein